MASNRYHRQELLPQIGREGGERLRAARVLLVGCGALGSVLADYLVRAGVGHLVIADRDIVEWTNLQRQTLFDEDDARGGVPKAVAAAERLRRVNSEVRVDPAVVDVHGGNVVDLLGGAGLVLDGTDNAETRYLVNDVSVSRGVPWVYGASVGWAGRVMTVLPDPPSQGGGSSRGGGAVAAGGGEGGPCLRCVYPIRPGGGGLATCDTAGVLGPAAGAVAALQAVQAIKILSGHPEATARELLVLDLWSNRICGVTVDRDPDCPCCGRREFPFLAAPPPGEGGVTLCGRDAVQVRGPAPLDLTAAAVKLRDVARLETTRYFLRCDVGGGVTLTLFADGRMIASGTRDPARARALYARYVGT